jgi:hypothetical protein
MAERPEHYSRDRKRATNGHTPGAHRPPLDGAVYKLRYLRPDGYSQTSYYSDPKLAQAAAEKLDLVGRLSFFARYAFEEKLDV